MFPCSAWAIAVLPCCKEGGVYNCMHMISWIVKCYVLLWRSFTSFTSFTWCEIWSHWSHNSDVNSETVVVCATITIMCLCFLLWFISDSYQFPWHCNQHPSWLSQSAISFPWDGREPSWKRSCTQRWRDREANKIQSREFQEREGKKLVKLENLAINIPIDNPQQHHVFSPVAVVSD